MLLFAAVSATAQPDRPYFPAAGDNAQAEIVRMINAEQERLDIATWYLNDGEIAQAIVNKHLSGVTVRVIGDRGSLFEADPNTRAWFEYLAKKWRPHSPAIPPHLVPVHHSLEVRHLQRPAHRRIRLRELDDGRTGAT